MFGLNISFHHDHFPWHIVVPVAVIALVLVLIWNKKGS